MTVRIQLKKYISGREPQGVGAKTKSIGGKPPVVK
jgi:hypothetical protein